jgi:MurNAc alpha-1-phosphate uridylyltransferase
MTLPSVVILAGGLGTRIIPASDGLPKILIPVLGRPFIDWKIEQLVDQGIQKIYLLLGHKSERVIEYLDGKDFDLEIVVLNDEPDLLGTAGVIRHYLDQLPEKFIVTYGDNLLDQPIYDFVQERPDHRENVLVVTTHVGPSDNLNTYTREDIVISYSKSEPGKCNSLDYGYLYLRKSAFDILEKGEKADLSTIVSDLASEGQLGAFITDRAYHEIGTLEGLKQTEEWLSLNTN